MEEEKSGGGGGGSGCCCRMMSTPERPLTALSFACLCDYGLAHTSNAYSQSVSNYWFRKRKVVAVGREREERRRRGGLV